MKNYAENLCKSFPLWKRFSERFKWNLGDYDFKSYTNPESIPKKQKSTFSNFKQFFDCVYIVNLKDEVSKYEKTLKILNSYNITNVKRVIAYDAINNPKQYRKLKRIHDQSATEHWKTEGLFRVPGAFGVHMSHIWILEDAISHKWKSILILEDDVVLHQDFYDLFMHQYKNLPDHWKMWQLGASQHGNWNELEINDKNQLYKVKPKTYGAFAYALKSEIFGLLWNEFQKHKLPNDVITGNIANEYYSSSAFVSHPNLIIADIIPSKTRGAYKETLNPPPKNDGKFKYPKTLHLYWGKTPLSFLNYLTVKSFSKYHPHWKIKIHISKNPTHPALNKRAYSGPCFLQKIKNIPNLSLHPVDLDNIGFNNEGGDTHKSEYFRYYILEKEGGVWSDFDILYLKSLEGSFNFTEESVIFKKRFLDLQSKELIKYHPVGLFLSQPKSRFFKFLKEQCANQYNSTNYQHGGTKLFQRLFSNEGSVYAIDEDLREHILTPQKPAYLPIERNKVHTLYESGSPKKFTSDTVGVCWFNGTKESQEYNLKLSKRINCFNPECPMDYLIEQFIA